MKSMFKLFLLSMLCFVLCAQASAKVSFPARPKPGVFIVDKAQLLSSQDVTAINHGVANLLIEKATPIFVVTIPSLSQYGTNGMNIETYAAQLFNHWGIGYKKHNFGILLLVSKGDRKARIELGSGWGFDKDSDSARIMSSIIVPNFKQGKFGKGIVQGVKALDQLARGNAVKIPKELRGMSSSRGGGTQISGTTMLIIGLIILGIIISLFRSGRTGWGWILIAAVGFIIVAVLSGGGRGGGGGFGGGSSGGGGATGSW